MTRFDRKAGRHLVTPLHDRLDDDVWQVGTVRVVDMLVDELDLAVLRERGIDPPRYLPRLVEPELINREQRMAERRIRRHASRR